MNYLQGLISKLRSAFGQNRPKVDVVLLGILLIVGGFWIYNNFSRVQTPEKKDEVKIEKSASTKADNGKDQGTVAGESTGPGIGGGSETATTNWVAREITADSLKDAATYKVQSGDTLWEIAKGKYGTGFDWHKILEANKDKVGFLPDGSQALIRPGQVLNLPG